MGAEVANRTEPLSTTRVSNTATVRETLRSLARSKPLRITIAVFCRLMARQRCSVQSRAISRCASECCRSRPSFFPFFRSNAVKGSPCVRCTRTGKIEQRKRLHLSQRQYRTANIPAGRRPVIVNSAHGPGLERQLGSDCRLEAGLALWTYAEKAESVSEF